jgi:hypothetical protein
MTIHQKYETITTDRRQVVEPSSIDIGIDSTVGGGGLAA